MYAYCFLNFTNLGTYGTAIRTGLENGLFRFEVPRNAILPPSPIV